MNLEQLTAAFREDAQDRVEEYLWAEPDVTRWFNEAQDEAAIRGRLLMDDYTPEVCRITLVAGQPSYPLHSKLYEIAHLRIEGAGEVALVTREWLDRKEPDWRTRDMRHRSYAIQSDTRLRLVPEPASAGTLVLEGYRLPLKQLRGDNDKPEIHEAHHAQLVHWVLYRAFSKPDADGFDPNRATQAYAMFEKYFGLRPDSDLRRATRQDEPHANANWFA